MPTLLYLIILGGILYCFWLFMKTATPRQMGKLMLILAVITIVIGLFSLAVVQRLPLALGILMALWPLLAAFVDVRRKTIIERDLAGDYEIIDDSDDIVSEQDLYDDAPYIYQPRVKDDFNKSA